MALLSQIFLAANQSLSYGCYNKTGVDKARSQTLVVANLSLSKVNREMKSSQIKIGLQ